MTEQDPTSSSEGYVRDAPGGQDELMTTVLEEYQVAEAQTEKRRALLRELEDQDGSKNVGYIAFLCSEKAGASASIDSEDIPAIGNALMSIGDVEQLNLILNSPGGDGTVAEKIIELCRAYCDEFRVVIPNRAKSAATVVALGADSIVMGYSSEIGPIDAQVYVLAGGLPRAISTQSVIGARDSLLEQYKEAKEAGEDTQPILQQIANLDPAFIDHCERLMDFSKDVARKYLGEYMFADLAASEKRERIDTVIDYLSASEGSMVHGRMIDGNIAKTDLDLDVELLPKDDELWNLIWEYYIRADIFMNMPPPSAKLVETRNEKLIMSRRSSSTQASRGRQDGRRTKE